MVSRPSKIHLDRVSDLNSPCPRDVFFQLPAKHGGFEGASALFGSRNGENLWCLGDHYDVRADSNRNFRKRRSW